MVAGGYLVAAVLEFISLKFIYNLDKKTWTRWGLTSQRSMPRHSSLVSPSPRPHALRGRGVHSLQLSPATSSLRARRRLQGAMRQVTRWHGPLIRRDPRLGLCGGRVVLRAYGVQAEEGAAWRRFCYAEGSVVAWLHSMRLRVSWGSGSCACRVRARARPLRSTWSA